MVPRRAPGDRRDEEQRTDGQLRLAREPRNSCACGGSRAEEEERDDATTSDRHGRSPAAERRAKTRTGVNSLVVLVERSRFAALLFEQRVCIALDRHDEAPSSEAAGRSP